MSMAESLMQDEIFERAILNLEAQRSDSPCEKFIRVSRLLSNYCECGWNEDEHKSGGESSPMFNNQEA